MSLIALIAAIIAFHEGLICLLILFPLFYVSILVGALAGRVIFKTHPTRLQVSLLPLLILGILGEPLTRVERQDVVVEPSIWRNRVCGRWS
jgi:hypothetical protein